MFMDIFNALIVERDQTLKVIGSISVITRDLKNVNIHR